jgi:acetyl esterase/lipase
MSAHAREGADLSLEGRLGDPGRTLATDPRSDPRMIAALAPFALDGYQPPPPVSAASPLAEQLAFCAAAEEGFQAVFGVLVDGLAPVDGVTSESATIAGDGGHDIALTVHRPAKLDGPVPCIVHLHGGGMDILEAKDPVYVRWRDELAATGLVVVGVEFRNGAGKLGCHPYPAGLQDCVSAVRWAAAQRADLGASHVVVSGESGGGNLTLSVALTAKREGWQDEIAGVYAQCPFISNAWAAPPEDLTSLRENDGYFLTCELLAVLAAVYDPGSVHADEETCWPLRAAEADLAGLPPHMISVNELDPLRDEGLAYYRRLRRAGVSAMARIVAGTCHGGDVLFGGAMPDVHAASVRDVSGFAHAVAS